MDHLWNADKLYIKVSFKIFFDLIKGVPDKPIVYNSFEFRPRWRLVSNIQEQVITKRRDTWNERNYKIQAAYL